MEEVEAELGDGWAGRVVTVAVVMVECAGEERCEGVWWGGRWGEGGRLEEWIPESSVSSEGGRERRRGERASITCVTHTLSNLPYS